MDKVERVMKMVTRMSPRKKRSERGSAAAAVAAGQPPHSPDTFCDELCRFGLCIAGECVRMYQVEHFCDSSSRWTKFNPGWEKSAPVNSKLNRSP